mmetsp:Transcript_34441/g.68892  ORF Transcript_34441/g.68892 Transcript_34441/m.68892 type:complete len:128 (-) Transcript_34441:52-435(-)
MQSARWHRNREMDVNSAMTTTMNFGQHEAAHELLTGAASKKRKLDLDYSASDGGRMLLSAATNGPSPGHGQIEYDEWMRLSMPQPPLFIIRQLCMEAAQRRVDEREPGRSGLENQESSCALRRLPKA